MTYHWYDSINLFPVLLAWIYCARPSRAKTSATTAFAKPNFKGEQQSIQQTTKHNSSIKSKKCDKDKITDEVPGLDLPTNVTIHEKAIGEYPSAQS